MANKYYRFVSSLSLLTLTLGLHTSCYWLSRLHAELSLLLAVSEKEYSYRVKKISVAI